MKELLNIAAKCDTMIGLAAIVVVCLTVLALAIFVLLPCVKMVLGTILNYRDILSPPTLTLRGGGFSLKHSNEYSINELSPCAPRFYVQVMLIPIAYLRFLY